MHQWDVLENLSCGYFTIYRNSSLIFLQDIQSSLTFLGKPRRRLTPWICANREKVRFVQLISALAMFSSNPRHGAYDHGPNRGRPLHRRSLGGLVHDHPRRYPDIIEEPTSKTPPPFADAERKRRLHNTMKSPGPPQTTRQTTLPTSILHILIRPQRRFTVPAARYNTSPARRHDERLDSGTYACFVPKKGRGRGAYRYLVIRACLCFYVHPAPVRRAHVSASCPVLHPLRCPFYPLRRFYIRCSASKVCVVLRPAGPRVRYRERPARFSRSRTVCPHPGAGGGERRGSAVHIHTSS
ncbi:hypothetical protein B0H17DRAFT_555583 [Mycena rosella]|uniref:Uncharacterized protein n=1 Tax=Mycena rosella TaxID=1033263 RepID=A0AAD7DHW5_MYCRO|nr:hypothetical protein B0H17DRAFT_555583 [Mycena rosella]